MKSRSIVLAVLVALQAVFLLAWAGYHELALRRGIEVRLETRPVDPRDILRGDYMILNYQISRQRVPYGWTPTAGDEVFVVLTPNERFYSASEVVSLKPDRADRRPWVRATVRNVAGNDLWLDYGIERYFVPEGMGTPKFRSMEVVAVIDSAHRLYIKELWLDGKTYP